MFFPCIWALSSALDSALGKRALELANLRPSQTVALTFAALIGFGASLLTFPAAAVDGQGLGLTDAVFTMAPPPAAFIERLETEIQDAKQSYRERARHAYMHGRRNSLALILSAGSVNQMIVRARYLQQFASRRRAQVDRIAQKTGEMRTREVAVRSSLEETQRLLQQSQAEQTRIAQSRRERERRPRRAGRVGTWACEAGWPGSAAAGSGPAAGCGGRVRPSWPGRRRGSRRGRWRRWRRRSRW